MTFEFDRLLTEVLHFGLDRLADAGWAPLEPGTPAPRPQSPSPGGREPHFYLPDRRALHWALASFTPAEPA